MGKEFIFEFHPVNQSKQTKLIGWTNKFSSLTSQVLSSGNGMIKRLMLRRETPTCIWKICHLSVFGCSLPGHMSNECPNTQLNAYVENLEGETGVDFGNDLDQHIDEFAQVSDEVVNLWCYVL